MEFAEGVEGRPSTAPRDTVLLAALAEPRNSKTRTGKTKRSPGNGRTDVNGRSGHFFESNSSRARN